MNNKSNRKYVDNLIEYYSKDVEYYSFWLEKWHLDKELKVVDKILDKIIKKNFHKDALDIACHTGRYAFLLGKKGLNVLGIDSSDKALDVAKKTKAKLGINNVEFKKVDATKLNVKNLQIFEHARKPKVYRQITKKFDIIILMELLHHLPDDLAIELFRKAITLLKPNGYVIFDVKNINNPVINGVYKKYSSEKLLLITRSIDFFARIAKKHGCKILLKKALVTPFWKIEPFVIVVLRKLE